MGTQEPPARRSARLVVVAAQRAGPSCALPGQAVPTEPRATSLIRGSSSQWRKHSTSGRRLTLADQVTRRGVSASARHRRKTNTKLITVPAATIEQITQVGRSSNGCGSAARALYGGRRFVLGHSGVESTGLSSAPNRRQSDLPGMVGAAAAKIRRRGSEIGSGANGAAQSATLAD